MSIAKEIRERYIQYSNIVLRRRRLFYAAILAPLVFTLIFTAMMPPSYVADGVILPTIDSSQMGFVGVISGLFGRSTPSGSDGAPSSFLYVDILKSDTIIKSVLTQKISYNDGDEEVSGTVAELLGFPSRNAAIEDFLDRAKARMNPENGIINISFTASHPELAAAVVNTWIEKLDKFNREVRVTQADQSVEYLEERLATVRRELEEVSDSLVEYLRANRGYPQVSSPEVGKNVRMLENRRDIKESMYELLKNQYEMARLNQQKETPVVSVLDPGIPVYEKAGPQRIPVFLASLLFVGIILAFALIMLEADDPTTAVTPAGPKEIKAALKEDYRELTGLFRRKNE